MSFAPYPLEFVPDPPYAREWKLTQQQIFIARKIIDGDSNKDIAESMKLTEDTVKRHISEIMDKAGLNTRTAILAEAYRLGGTGFEMDPEWKVATPLTNREAEILAYTAEGRTVEQIHLLLGISQETVKRHTYNIYEKLGVDTRLQAARVYFKEILPRTLECQPAHEAEASDAIQKAEFNDSRMSLPARPISILPILLPQSNSPDTSIN